MTDIIQSSTTNPAFLFENKAIIGIPSLAFNYGNNAFAYRDLIRQDQDGQSYLDVENIIGKLSRRNYLQTQLNIDLFRIHFKMKDWYLSISSSEKMNIKLGYSRDLVELAWYGNANKIGQTMDLAPELNMTYYRELSFGVGYKKESWQMGARFKYLTGIADLASSDESITLYTDEAHYAITVETDFLLNSAGVNNFLKDPLQAAFSFSNSGFAMDLGGTYQFNEKWSMAASIVNLGFIRWKDDVTNYSSRGSFTFQGIELESLFEEESFSFDELQDSLEANFGLKENQDPYTSHLVPRLYVSTAYSFRTTSQVSALFYGEIFDGFQPAMALHYQEQVNAYFSIGASYSIKNKTYANFGLSTVISYWKMQAFFVSDNFVSVFIPKRSKSVNFRAGINFRL
ncbi:MAG: DUF5723 family protein [Chitinophagales bacterium]